MICPFQNGNKCQEADCPLWKNDCCRLPDAIDAEENIASSLADLASDLADIRGQLCPKSVPSSWEHFGGGRHKNT